MAERKNEGLRSEAGLVWSKLPINHSVRPSISFVRWMEEIEAAEPRNYAHSWPHPSQQEDDASNR